MRRRRRRRIAGIYCLICRFTAQRYVGRSVDIEGRVKAHFRRLNLGEHRNRLLQRVFDDWGESGFEWRVLEEFPYPYGECILRRLYLLAAEKRWMTDLDPFFNRIIYDVESRKMVAPAATWDRMGY